MSAVRRGNALMMNEGLGLDNEQRKGRRTVGLVGLPFSGGQPFDGVEAGVQLIRENGIIQSLEELDWKVTDHGDINVTKPNKRDTIIGGYKNSEAVGEANYLAYQACKESAKVNDVTLAIGGDHSLAMGTVAGNAAVNPDQVVFWIDAHGDINDGTISPTGNIHGMPLAFLTGIVDPKTVKGMEWLTPCLNPRDIVYVGLRDIDKSEKMVLRQHGIKCFTMHDVDHYGIGTVMKMAMDHIDPYRKRPIHVSYDIDSGDPSVCPSTGTRVPGGLTFRELHYVSEALYATGQIRSMDLVEVNPSIGTPDEVDRTVKHACSVIKAAFGDTLL